MGEDWREFRARLVAQEQIEDEINSFAEKGGSRKEEKFNFITGAISSIFSKKEDKEGEKNKPFQKSSSTEKSAESSADIFDGDSVGGATKFSKIPHDCSDPFMDEQECHLIYDEPDVKLDKHKWAHPLFHVEPGCILVANEKLGGVFHQTVVLIIDHNEKAGSTGMVINRPFPGNQQTFPRRPNQDCFRN